MVNFRVIPVLLLKNEGIYNSIGFKKWTYIGDPINVVNDQFGQPTNAEDLSKLVISALDNKVPSGIHHGSNSGATTWHDFAVEIFKLAGAEASRVKAISSKNYKTKASRPEYSVLDNSKWTEFGIKPLVFWQESVARAFPAIYESLGQ